MPQILFRSRWVAIVWVAGVLMAVSFFFNGGGRDMVDRAAADLRTRKAVVEAPTRSTPVIAPAPEPRVIIRRIDDPAELARYRALEKAQKGEPEPGEGPSDRYVVVDKSAMIEDATADDLRRYAETH